MKRKIKIFDTTLRDGEQSPGASMSENQKLEMAIMIDKLGVDRIEAGFPVSSATQFNSVKKISESIHNATVVALARCVKKDIEIAFESLKNAKKKMLHIFIATSPIHRKYKLKMSKKDIISSISESIRYAKNFFSEIEFSPEDATRTEKEFLFEVVETALNNGVTTINIPDTVGYSVPGEFAGIISELKRNIPLFKSNDLSVHCHNDLGLAVANSLAAVEAGADQVEVTVNGIGERAGNCSLEEFVMTLETRKDLFNLKTGINTEQLYSSSSLLQSITGLLIPRNKPITGDNAFLHESGIHQHGVINRKETYEIIKPEKVGHFTETLIMGRHSGKHSFKEKLDQYEINLSKKEFEKAFKNFQILADRKKEVYDEEIFSVIPAKYLMHNRGFKLINFYSCTGKGVIPSCTLKLEREEREYISSATGNGPIDALFKAINKASGIKSELKEYTLQSIGSGRDAQGQVKVIIRVQNRIFTGRGTSTDIIEASATAYLNSINNYLLSTKNKLKQRPITTGKRDWQNGEAI